MLGDIENLDELPDVQKAVELLKKAFNGEGPVAASRAPATPPAKSRPKGSLKEVKVLLDEVKMLKKMNADLIARVEAKDKELEAAAARRREASEPAGTKAKAEAVPPPPGTITDPAPPRSYTGEQVGCVQIHLNDFWPPEHPHGISNIDPTTGGRPQAEVRPAVRGEGAPEERRREGAPPAGRQRRAQEETQTGNATKIVFGGKFKVLFADSGGEPQDAERGAGQGAAADEADGRPAGVREEGARAQGLHSGEVI